MEEFEDWHTSDEEQIEDDGGTVHGCAERTCHGDDHVGGEWMGGTRMEFVDGACAATEHDDICGENNDDDSAEFMELWSGEVESHYK